MSGIPTTHRGINMRSLLEAKWAGFFTLLGWRWEYEPTEFNGWIPDFVLIGKKQITYVEVKPTNQFPKEVAAKIDASDCTDEVLIVGLYPSFHYNWPDTEPQDNPPLGWLGECDKNDPTPRWWQNADWHDLGGIGFHATGGCFRNRITGEYDGDDGCSALFKNDTRAWNTRMLWVHACNRAQWRGRR
jgi:hypothetical protein